MNERLIELLTDRALTGLSPREQIELAELLVQEQGLEAGAFDNAASAAAIAAMAGSLEAMPADLIAKIEQQAIAQLGARPATDYHKTAQMPVASFEEKAPETVKAPHQYQATMPFVATSTAPPPPASMPAPSNVVPFPTSQPQSQPLPIPIARPSRGLRVVAVAGWIAAAACLALAIGAIYIRRPQPVVVLPPAPLPTPTVVEPPAPPVPAIETAADLKKKLLAVAGTVHADWATTKDPAGKQASGDVVWNKDQQRGTMTFRGLGRNDAKVSQYQLWIFDKTRDDKYPVDGGVFDIDADTGDVTVPIKAAIPVNNATLFAITVEKPGGVVVSKREHLVLAAKL